jgi:hypothetical protein
MKVTGNSYETGSVSQFLGSETPPRAGRPAGTNAARGVSQMERTYTLERAAHARAAPTAKGRRISRPSVVDPHKLAYAAHLREAGDTIAEIVAKTGITRSSLYRHLPPRPAYTVTVRSLIRQAWTTHRWDPPYPPHQKRAAAQTPARQVCAPKTSTVHRARPLRLIRASAVIKGTWRASAKATYWAS